ncbi:MAG: hypothetical protein ACTHLR_10385 [Rhizomicrobium sp.]
MNVRVVAALLLADQELEELQRLFKRQGDWRTARRISDVREKLSRTMADEQRGLRALVVEYQNS